MGPHLDDELHSRSEKKISEPEAPARSSCWRFELGCLMRTFHIALTGDFLNEQGASAYGDLSLSLWDEKPFLQYHFLKDLAPRPGDASYWSRIYSLEITPQHIDGIDGLVVVRPRVKRSTFAQGAKDLVVIGRSGTGYDKIDLAACTENDVALFNAPEALRHSTASSALLF